MTAENKKPRKSMPKGICWDAGDSPRRAFGARQDARGRRDGHVDEWDGVNGSEQSPSDFYGRLISFCRYHYR